MNEEYLRHLFEQEFDLRKALIETEETGRSDVPTGSEAIHTHVYQNQKRLLEQQQEFISDTISLYIKLHSK